MLNRRGKATAASCRLHWLLKGPCQADRRDCIILNNPPVRPMRSVLRNKHGDLPVPILSVVWFAMIRRWLWPILPGSCPLQVLAGSASAFFLKFRLKRIRAGNSQRHFCDIPASFKATLNAFIQRDYQRRVIADTCYNELRIDIQPW